MNNTTGKAIAIVGLGAILPDAPNVTTFWENLVKKRYSITEVPADRWSVADYYDPDPRAPDKTYSKIGGWVRDFEFDWKRFRMPPKVSSAMDQSQQWAVTIAADALADYGYPQRPLDSERTAVILGTAMGGELHYLTHLRIVFPEFARALKSVTEFKQLPSEIQGAILDRWHEVIDQDFPPITEDSMPGELPNIVSGRVANMLNLRGPNFITDAACAASFAAVNAAVELLGEHQVDAVITGGVDRNMGISSFVKFCKIGALSSTGTRPFGEGADGFVMGEGAAAFLLKRLEDAEAAGDNIYAVIRGVGGASDGKGKGITAPNPIGQQLAMQRAWDNADIDPATATLIEAHGTSTKVGDVVEVDSLTKVFGGAPDNNIALGSVKSNIGHLKAGAGAAGLLKATLAVCHQVLPPTLNAERPNPNIDFAGTPLYINHDVREWRPSNGTPRRCGISAYGFGGTNFHIVLEEHISGYLTQKAKMVAAVSAGNGNARSDMGGDRATPLPAGRSSPQYQDLAPPRGILVAGAKTPNELKEKLDNLIQRVESGWTPPIAIPEETELQNSERLVFDFGDHEELLDRLSKAQKAMAFDSPQTWKAMQAQGIFRGNGHRPGKVAFLFPGQGSQYVNMGRELANFSPVVAEVIEDADQIMAPILGKPLTDYIFVDESDKGTIMQAQFDLMQTAITQPAMLTLDIAMFRLLGEYGFDPDMVMGHSLGEYAALIASGAMPFADALEAAAARGSEMSKVTADFSDGDNGKMAAVLAPFEVVEATLAEIDGYVVPANINSHSQCVFGGASTAVEQAVGLFEDKGFKAMQLPVSHAFHTRIVAPAGDPLREVLDRLNISSPKIPLVANVTGDFYATTAEGVKDILQKQVSSPVQWVKGLETLYAAGVRTFVEVGPKRALRSFVNDVFADKPEVVALITNHPKFGELPTFNQALCGLYAAGHGLTEDKPAVEQDIALQASGDGNGYAPIQSVAQIQMEEVSEIEQPAPIAADAETIKKIVAHTLKQMTADDGRPYDHREPPSGSVVISGTGLGLPGAEKAVMDPENSMRILRGEQLVDLIPDRFRKLMLKKRITRLVKSPDGGGRFETITDSSDVVKLAGRGGSFDLAEEYGVPQKLVDALDITTQLAMAAGLDALRKAGLPLVLAYRRMTTGKFLPERWILPASLRDETGVIFASAFPGTDRFAEEFERYFAYKNRIEQLETLEDLRNYTTDAKTLQEIHRRIANLREKLDREPYTFDRRFIFRILSMGHSQFAEYIGARGPNTQVNSACSSTTQAIAIAEDWIRSGRCRRVIVIGADNVTGDNLMEWVGAGFLAMGAAATDDSVEEAALPFDVRRHGTLLGMGSCALVVESEDAVRERGMRGIVELLSSESRNSAFHGSRLDVEHIAAVMDDLVTTTEQRFGLHRQAIASQLVFMSHETFTPARGGSASAEIFALRQVFDESANDIVIANTKGFTGHPMGVGIEDVIALKILEHGIVPPVPNYKEEDPELGPLNLSRGGRYPVLYALHLAAGFGSQIALTLTRYIPGSSERLDNKPLYQRWLDEVSGYDWAETEVEKRVLRVRDQGVPKRPPAACTWQYGTGPTVRAAIVGGGPAVETPTRMVLPDIEPAPEPVVVGDKGLETGDQGAVDSDREELISDQKSAVGDQEPVVSDQSSAVDPIADKVLAIVAEQTGYPMEMLELDLDLEADLGVDTVKQAETFLSIREAFDIPRQDDLQLSDYPTLGHVIEFVQEMRPEVAEVSEQPLAEDRVTEKVLAIVAEQTGYPMEMLELDLDLEADLGVDTVKQAETILSIREAFDIPRQDDLQLGDYPTLGHVIEFVREMRPRESVSSERRSVTGSQRPVVDLSDADRMPRRIPVPFLRPSLDLCKSTGVALGDESRVVVVSDRGGIGKALVKRLHKLGATALILDPSLDKDELGEKVDSWLEAGPIQGVYWLPALDVEPELESMELDDWRQQNRLRVKNLYVTMRALFDAVNEPGKFLVTGTRLGGLHGYGEEGATAPLGGAVAGFSKSFKRERSDTLVKVVDFEVSRKTAAPAELLIAETLKDPGVVEVGYWQDGRYSIGLAEAPADDSPADLTLNEETIFLITGAAGGITSAIVDDLALASSGTFYLLDLVDEPVADDPQVELFHKDKEALKQRFIEEFKEAWERPTPVKIEKMLAAVERKEAALRTIASVEAAGGEANYRCVNLLDSEAVTAVIQEIQQQHGRIDVLIHAGGVEVSRALPDKDPAQFDLVFDVKVDGYFNLLKAAKGMPIGAILAFSSVAGRFGNAGQTDYSAANDLLCKITSSLRRWRPETRGIVIDWTAWSNIGMATRGSVPKIMEMAGIEMLPPEVGIPTVRRELVSGDFRGEVVVAGELGMLVDEWDETGGLDLEQANQWLARQEPQLLMVGKLATANVYGQLEVETILDPNEQPFLYDHSIAGTPLLPGVMGTETFAQLATAFAPGFRVAAIRNEHFYRAFKFHQMEPQTLYLGATITPAEEGGLVAHCSLKSRSKSGKESVRERERIHFTADVHLTREQLDKPSTSFAPPLTEEMPIADEQIYKIYFHGPAYKVLDRVQVSGDRAIGLMAESLPPDTEPGDAAALIAPRLLELCFQTVGVWEIKTRGTVALPSAVGVIRTYRQPSDADDKLLYALVEAMNDGRQFDAQVVDEDGHLYLEVASYETVQLPGTVSL